MQTKRRIRPNSFVLLFYSAAPLVTLWSNSRFNLHSHSRSLLTLIYLRSVIFALPNFLVNLIFINSSLLPSCIYQQLYIATNYFIVLLFNILVISSIICQHQQQICSSLSPISVIIISFFCSSFHDNQQASHSWRYVAITISFDFPILLLPLRFIILSYLSLYIGN